jgi:hypothetical protein
MPNYRVQIINPDGAVAEERQVTATSPDNAALIAANEPVVRGEKGVRKVLRVKVYFDSGGSPTLVRYYRDSSRVVSF